MQTTNNILLIRPCNFSFNAETISTNAFQNETKTADNDFIKNNAIEEFDLFAKTLKSKGVNVFIFNDTPSPVKPDAIFPNNWITFHADGTVILYPMCAHNRQLERRQDIIDSLRQNFKITNIIDFSNYEKENKFLEGTGSIIFDHTNKIAYACLSPRTDKDVFIKVCEYLHYKPVYFSACDRNGIEIYHTNVMLCIGEKFAVICSDSILNSEEKEMVMTSLSRTGHQLIDITFEQMNHFAGNMLEIRTKENKNILVLSQSSFVSLTEIQKNELLKFVELIPLSIKTIETIGGGSARCMIAEVFLEPIEN